MTSNRPVRSRLRRLVLALAALMLAIAASAVASLVIASGQVTQLSTAIAPALDANSAVLQSMTDAEAALRGYQATADPGLLRPYGDADDRLVAARDRLRSVLPLIATDAADLARLRTLQRDQDTAVSQWWDHAAAAEAAAYAGRAPDIDTGSTLFQRFREVNTELSTRIRAQRDASRTSFRDTLTRDTALVVAITGLALLAALLTGHRVSRSLTGPIIDLRDVVARQRGGDASARARDDEGALEVRSLAGDFNALSEDNLALLQSQAAALTTHQLTLDVERLIRAATDVPEALDVVCRAMGEGLHVDRVMANTIDEAGDVVLGAQWQASRLAPLPDIPEELVVQVGRIADRLWSSSGRLVLDDFHQPQVQADWRARLFGAETGARAAIIAPIGLGDRVIGMVYVLTVRDPRQWTTPEANAVQQVCAFAARAIVEGEHQEHQRDYVARLEQLDRQKTDFLSTVSHELRTPLTSISGYLELLQDGDAGELAPAQQRMLVVVERNTTRLRGLIEDLLVLNRIESGGLHVTTTEVSVCQLLTETAEELRPLADSAGVRLQVDSGPESSFVEGDRSHLHRAVVNLLSNAVKFTPPGGTVTLACGTDDAGTRASLSCRDTGIGIPSGDLDRLFSRFFRAANATSRAIPGTGLGLAIVKTIVEDHGGTLALTSVEGHGTEVVVELPLIPGNAGGQAGVSTSVPDLAH